MMFHKQTDKAARTTLLQKARTAQDQKDYQQAAFLYLEHAHEHEEEERKQAEQFLRAAQCFERLEQQSESARWYLKAAECYAALAYLSHALSALKACYRISGDKASLHTTLQSLMAHRLWHDDMLNLLSDVEDIYFRICHAKKFKESVFASIKDVATFEKAMQWMFIESVEQDGVIMRYNAKASDLYFLVTGKVEALIPQQTRIDSMGYIDAMELIGEAAFFLDYKRVTQVIAVSDCTLLRIPYDNIPKLQAYLPTLKAHMANLYCERILLCRLAVAPVFSELDMNVRTEISKHIFLVHLHTNDYLFREGEPRSNVYIVLSGVVGIQIRINHQECLLKTVGVNSTIGEISIISQNRRTASIIAMEKTTLLCIPEVYFHQLYNENTELRWVLKVRKQSQLKESQYFIREQKHKTLMHDEHALGSQL